MKHPWAMGILIILGASSCAPVASSVPKLATTSPRTGDSIIDEHGKFDLGTISNVAVVSSDQADAKIKALKADGYTVNPAYDQRDREFADLREARAIRDIKLAAELNRVEITTVIVLKSAARAVPDGLEKNLDIDWSRNKKNEFSLVVSLDDASGAAWAYVKDNLDSIVIASREAKAKK